MIMLASRLPPSVPLNRDVFARAHRFPLENYQIPTFWAASRLYAAQSRPYSKNTAVEYVWRHKRLFELNLSRAIMIVAEGTRTAIVEIVVVGGRCSS